MANQSQIARAYQRWLLNDAHKEASTDCRRLRGILDAGPMFFVDLTKDWSNEERLTLMRACIKRRGTFRVAPEPLTSDESQKLQKFDSPGLWSRWGEMRTRLVNGEFKVDKRTLRDAVRARLRPLLGRDYAKGCLRYVTHVRDVTVYTDVTVGGRGTTQLQYEQMIVAGRVDEHVGIASDDMVVRGVSFAAIISRPTQWTYMTDLDVPQAVELLARLCMEFIDGVPEILDAC